MNLYKVNIKLGSISSVTDISTFIHNYIGMCGYYFMESHIFIIDIENKHEEDTYVSLYETAMQYLTPFLRESKLNEVI